MTVHPASRRQSQHHRRERRCGQSAEDPAGVRHRAVLPGARSAL